MAVKSIIKCSLINKDSKARMETEIDINKPFTTNLIVAARQSMHIQRELISPKDRAYLKGDAFDGKFLDSIEVSAVIGEAEVKLDVNKAVKDAWKEAVKKDVPLSDEQAFLVMVNGFSRDSKEGMMIPVDEKADERNATMNIEMANNLLEDNKILLEDKKMLLEDKKQLKNEVNSLIKEINDLKKTNNDLGKRPTVLRLFVYVLAGFIAGALIGAVFFAVKFHVNPLTAGQDTAGTESTAINGEFEDFEKTIKEKDDEISKLQEDIKAYEEKIKKKDSTIEELEKKLEKYETNPAVSGTEEEQEVSTEESQVPEVGESQEGGVSEGQEASTADKAQPEGEREETQAEGTKAVEKSSDSEDFLKMDSALMQNSNRVEYISKGNNSGKVIQYTALRSEEEGILINLGPYSSDISEFNIAVPEGYTRFTFEIGHIKDAGAVNMRMDVLIDGVSNESLAKVFNYNKTSEVCEVTGLTGNTIITFRFHITDGYYRGGSSYGMTNLMFHKN